MVPAAARAADSSSGEPFNDGVVRQHKVQHAVNARKPCQRIGLRYGPGEAVEYVAVARVESLKPLSDNRYGQLVGDEVAPVKDRFDLLAEWALVLDCRAEEISRRDMGNLVLLRNLAGRSPLTRARWAQKDQIHDASLR